VIQALTELAERYPRYGFKKLFQLLRRQGNRWNHKRVHRIYYLLKLNRRLTSFIEKNSEQCAVISRVLSG